VFFIKKQSRRGKLQELPPNKVAKSGIKKYIQNVRVFKVMPGDVVT